MAARILTSLVGLPITIFIVAYGGLPLQIAVCLLALIGMYEFYNALSGGRKTIHLIGYFFSAFYFGLLHTLNSNLLFILSTSLVLTILFFLVFFHAKNNIIDGAIALMGVFYVAFMLSFIYIVRSLPQGHFFVWLIFISAWGSDTGAYFTGIAVGKHKLCPTLSPKKTVEGSIGGIVFAVAVALIFGYVMNFTYGSNNGLNMIIALAITTFFAAICSQLGDLSASAIKRFTGIKDFGKLMPGHGGVLDRFDSIMFTAPIVFLMMVLYERFL